MAVSLSELLAQKDALERQIQAARSTAKANAIAQVRQLMSEHGLTTADLAQKSILRSPSGKKVAAKYRDPVSGSTWTGRGLRPKWLTSALATGKSLTDFAI